MLEYRFMSSLLEQCFKSHTTLDGKGYTISNKEKCYWNLGPKSDMKIKWKRDNITCR